MLSDTSQDHLLPPTPVTAPYKRLASELRARLLVARRPEGSSTHVEGSACNEMRIKECQREVIRLFQEEGREGGRKEGKPKK